VPATAQPRRRAPTFRALAVCAAVFALLALVVPRGAEAARIQCAGTFRVLHNDHIGRLALPKGSYTITTLASGRPSCSEASRLFAAFLQDYDGRLPRPWRVGVANKTFVKEPGVGFHVRRLGVGGGGGVEEEAGGGGRHPAVGRFCPATFRVLHNDRIGALRLRAGRYWIALLKARGLSCAQASRLFTRFLDDFSGNLPRPWRLNAQTASFSRGGGVGFRVKPVR
jgi:hypothetical protein